jgi:hypothetical protein
MNVLILTEFRSLDDKLSHSKYIYHRYILYAVFLPHECRIGTIISCRIRCHEVVVLRKPRNNSRQLTNTVGTPICLRRGKLFWLLDLEQPALFIFNLALLKTLQSRQKLGACGWDFFLCCWVGELVTPRVHGNGPDRHECRSSTGSKNLIEAFEFIVRNLQLISMKQVGIWSATYFA